MSTSKRAERPELVTVVAAAQRVGVNPRTVRRWIERGAIRGYRLADGRQVRVRADDVDRIVRPIDPERP